MAYLRDSAIVLRKEPYREHDAWISFYGKEHGKIEAVARGAYNISAKHLGHLEPFSEVEVMIARGKTFDKVAVAQAKRPRSDFHWQFASLQALGVVIRCVDHMTRPGISDERLYAVLVEALEIGERLSKASPDRARLFLTAVEWKFLDMFGYAPSLDRCSRCQKLFEKSVTISMHSGEWECSRCHPRAVCNDSSFVTLPPQTVTLLRFLRSRSLHDVLRLTMPTSLFRAAERAVESGFVRTPFHEFFLKEVSERSAFMI